MKNYERSLNITKTYSGGMILGMAIAAFCQLNLNMTKLEAHLTIDSPT